MRRHQHIPSSFPHLPLWKLLLGEVLVAVRRLLEPRRGIPALIAAALVVVGLAASTPGPVLDLPARIAAALAAALAAAWSGPRLWHGRHRSR